MDLERYLTILILRTLGLSQDAVADLVHCAKQTVGEAERWFASCPQGEAFALVDDQGIRRLVGREFPDMELSPNQMIKAGQVTGDDILLHYGRVRPHEVAEGATPLAEVEPAARVAPVYIKLLERHWGKLCQQAITFRTQLWPPGIEALFGAEVCHKVYHAIQSGSSLLSTSSWTNVVDAPLELKLLSGTARERTVEVRLSVEEEFLFLYLVSHLQAEFAEFIQFDVWKSQLGHLIQTCLERAESVTRSCSGAAGMYYLGKSIQKGLLWYFPAYVCQFVFDHFDSETAPKLATELRPDGLWKLVDEERPAVTLALDTETHIRRCQEVLVNEVRDNAGLQVWHQIKRELTDLQTRAAQLRSMLTILIERGNFKGTCSLCEGYFTPSQSA